MKDIWINIMRAVIYVLFIFIFGFLAHGSVRIFLYGWNLFIWG